MYVYDLQDTYVGSGWMRSTTHDLRQEESLKEVQ